MPRAKTAQEHHLEGTQSQVGRTISGSDFKAGRPRFLSHLCPAARSAYKRACKLLEQRGTLTPGDESALAVYAEVYARWLDAKGELAKYGLMVTVTVLDSNGAPHDKRVKNPCLDIATGCERQLLALVKTLGLSPVDKDKVRLPKPKATEGDSIEDFLNSAPSPVLVLPKRHEEPPEPL